MIKPDMIPDEVVEAGVTAWLESASDYTRLSESIRASIAAAINAWPGMKLNPSWELRTHKRSVEMILPVSDPPKMDRKAAVAERLFGDD